MDDWLLHCADFKKQLGIAENRAIRKCMHMSALGWNTWKRTQDFETAKSLGVPHHAPQVPVFDLKCSCLRSCRGVKLNTFFWICECVSTASYWSNECYSWFSHKFAWGWHSVQAQPHCWLSFLICFNSTHCDSNFCPLSYPKSVLWFSVGDHPSKSPTFRSASIKTSNGWQGVPSVKWITDKWFGGIQNAYEVKEEQIQEFTRNTPYDVQ